MRLFTLTILALASAAALPQTVYTPSGSGGFGRDSLYNRQFNPKSLVTFSGTVTGVQVSVPMEGVGEVETILVRAANGGNTIVEVGPAWYVDNQDPRIRTRDWITVTGSKIIREGKGIIYATEIRKANRILALRDHFGSPYWAVSRLIPAPAEITISPSGSGTQAQPIREEPDPVVSTLTRTFATFNGRILRFVEWRPAGGTVPYVAAVVNANAMEVPIVLGPRWFIERQDVALNVGDLIVVDTLKPPGSDWNHARRITVNNQTLFLRSGDGTPAWLAWRQP